jgi:hypothetical protein
MGIILSFVMRIDLVVISTVPSGPTIISQNTEVIVSEETAEAVAAAREGDIPSITYEKHWRSVR